MVFVFSVIVMYYAVSIFLYVYYYLPIMKMSDKSNFRDGSTVFLEWFAIFALFFIPLLLLEGVEELRKLNSLYSCKKCNKLHRDHQWILTKNDHRNQDKTLDCPHCFNDGLFSSSAVRAKDYAWTHSHPDCPKLNISQMAKLGRSLQKLSEINCTIEDIDSYQQYMKDTGRS